DIEPEQGFDQVSHFFSDIAAELPPQRPTQQPLLQIPDRPVKTVHGDVPADAISFVWRLPSFGTEAYDAAAIALAIIGQGMTSRFEKKLIKAELAQAASADTLGLIGGNSFGFAQAIALPDIECAKLEATMVAELELFLAQGPTVAEVERVKIQLLREQLTQLADLTSRADAISGYATLFDDPNRVNLRIAEINRIDTEQVHQACRDYLSPDQCGTLRYLRQEQS
ncbi:MAG: insulinase family protein, partial [Propionibacteriaceae bacterium]|nr:insulinase family protein [Propionibacteriaceae bacterium]